MGNCFRTTNKRKSIDPINDDDEFLIDEDEIMKNIRLEDLELKSNVELRNYVQILYRQNEDLLKEIKQLTNENRNIDDRRHTIENQFRFFIDSN